MLKRSKFYLMIGLLVVAGGASCSRSLSQTSSSNSRQATKTESDERLGLINGDNDTDWFELTDREVVLSVSADNKLYCEVHSPLAEIPGKITKTEIAREQLAEMLNALVKNETPDRRIVHINADDDVPYQNVIQIMELVRKADIDRVGFIVVNENRTNKRNAGGFEVRLPAEPRRTKSVKPNPLTLVAELRPDGRLLLNSDDEGKISDPQKLEKKLEDVFHQREINGVFRENDNEIEKTVFLKATKSAKYIDILKVLSILKRAGAQPIGIQIDDLN